MVNYQRLNLEIESNVQRALLGAVSESLRAVSIDAGNNKIYYRCIFDDKATKNEKQLLSIAASEVVADFPETFTINEEYLITLESEKMDHLKHLVFLWYEASNQRI